MKSRLKIIGYLALIIFVAVIVASGATTTQAGTGENVEDLAITSKVKSLLAADDFLKSFQIGVETLEGNVQLSWFVGSKKAVIKAGEIARSVKGVKSVKNNLIAK